MRSIRDIEWRYRYWSGEKQRAAGVLLQCKLQHKPYAAAIEVLSAGTHPLRLSEEHYRRATKDSRHWVSERVAKSRKGVEGQFRRWLICADFDSVTTQGMENALTRASYFEAFLRVQYLYTEDELAALGTLAHAERGGG